MTDTNEIPDTDLYVIVVGYNVNSLTKGCNGYWIIKNQWGTSWGEYGLCRVCMTDDKLYPWGVANMFYYAAFSDVGFYG